MVYKRACTPMQAHPCMHAHACTPMHAHGNWRMSSSTFPYMFPWEKVSYLTWSLLSSASPRITCLYQNQPRTGITAVWGPVRLLMWVWGLELKPSHLFSKTSFPLSPNCDFFHLLVGAACGGQRTTCSQFLLIPHRLQKPNSNHQSRWWALLQAQPSLCSSLAPIFYFGFGGLDVFGWLTGSGSYLAQSDLKLTM